MPFFLLHTLLAKGKLEMEITLYTLEITHPECS